MLNPWASLAFPSPLEDARSLLPDLSAESAQQPRACCSDMLKLAEFYQQCIAKLGPDPLREDADPELLWAKVQKSRKPIGLILMDQSCVAGIGNIYRAEILFKVCSLLLWRAPA